MKYLALLSCLFVAGEAFAIQAQPVPIPEDPSISPQVDVSGVAEGTVGYAKNGDTPSGKARADFSDSALQIGAAQRLFEGGAVGSMAFGFLTTGEASQEFFLHRAFADYQGENVEALFGRSDNPSAHLVDFPALRGDDLLTLLNPLDPYSNGKNPEEHRYSDVASVTLNQGSRFFETVYAQHLLGTADPGVNAVGATFQALADPGLETFAVLPSWGAGYERFTAVSGGLNMGYAGGTLSLNHSVVGHLELGLQDIYTWGSGLRAFSSVTDSYQADANAAAASLRYLHAPFGRPSWQVALSGGFKKYGRVADANSWGFAVTGARRLGLGFDLVAQYEGQNRSAALAAVQSAGLAFEQRAEVGFAFNFDAAFNEHLAPRRSLLNQKHGFIQY